MGYTVNGKKYDYDSAINQEIKRKLIARDVYCCVTSMTEYILSKSWEDRDAPFSYDDVPNLYMPKCPECGDNYGFEEVDLAYKCTACEKMYEENLCVCPECEAEDCEEVASANKCEHCGHIVEETDELDTESQEIYEWWMVSDWLAERLAEKGECVLTDEGIWGRGCTGQAILLDYVISQVCNDMGILEGQEHEWSVK